MSRNALPAVSEAMVQNAIWLDILHGHPLICPCYTPPAWYECDVYAVTRAGYGVEFEIKLTRSDFKADAKKCNYGDKKIVGVPISATARDGYAWQKTTKHDRIVARDTKGPSRFWFVVPEGMLTEADVPEWSGLQTFTMRHGRINLYVVREAPRLHTEKVGTKTLAHLGHICSARFWHHRIEAARQAVAK